MYGIEIVKDANSKEPDPKRAADLFEDVRNQGVILGLGGLYKNILRVMPPMCVTLEDSEFLSNVLESMCEKHN
jgi:alanine-glyoxylate transaminase/(R)-3-amino-2-methylpropionate-pyruvate transaminase